MYVFQTITCNCILVVLVVIVVAGGELVVVVAGIVPGVVAVEVMVGEGVGI